MSNKLISLVENGTTQCSLIRILCIEVVSGHLDLCCSIKACFSLLSSIGSNRRLREYDTKFWDRRPDGSTKRRQCLSDIRCKMYRAKCILYRDAVGSVYHKFGSLFIHPRMFRDLTGVRKISPLSAFLWAVRNVVL